MNSVLVDGDKEMKKKVYLVDGSGYIFRAFYAVQPLSTKDGFPTNALFGFTRMLLRLLNEADSQHVVVVFDAGRETFRNQMYEQYKANRSECPEDLSKQMPFFREISRCLGLPVCELKGYEADDVIGTLTKRFSNSETETVIVSGDKDLLQLVGDHVSVWDTMKDKRYGREEVKEKFGVPPEQVVEVLALTGDASDNIPGLKGAGPKTATQLIEKYKDVETVIRSVAQIKEDSGLRNRKKIAEQIELDAEILRLSRRLVEVDTEAPVIIEDTNRGARKIGEIDDDELYHSMERHEINREELSQLIERLEFSSLLKDFNFGIPLKQKGPSTSEKYTTIWSEDFDGWFQKLAEQDSFSFDLETTSLDPRLAKIVGAAFCWNKEEAFYLPIGHTDPSVSNKQIDCSYFLKKLAPVLSDPKRAKIGQNLKFDIEILLRYGLTVSGVSFDTMVAAYLLNPDRRSYTLGSLARDYLGRGVSEYEDVVGGLESFADVSVVDATNYSAEDAHIAWLLKERLEPEIVSNELTDVFSRIEMPLVSVLAKMEEKGIRLDIDLLKSMSEEFQALIEKLEKELYLLAGCEFNLNSPKQLSDVLFNKLGISTKGLKKTKTGVSTDSSVLEQLSSQHPLPKILLQYRALFKLKSTYIDALPAQVSPITERLHTRFNQTVTATGRLSSSDPNLQNIPVQSKEGQRIRSAFIADKGKMLISADYSQIELRLLAHMSNDQTLIDTFISDIDVHERTAREILRIPADATVDPEQRRMGKTINFGIVYGMSGFRLGRELGIPVGVANQYIEDYFDRYPGVKEYFAELEDQMEREGCVRTLFGRKRVITEIDTRGRDRGFALRAAINAPLQGSAADIIKLAMIKIDERFTKENLPIDMILQIHDELVFECESSLVSKALDVVRHEMENVVELRVPLKVDAGHGVTWTEAQS